MNDYQPSIIINIYIYIYINIIDESLHVPRSGGLPSLVSPFAVCLSSAAMKCMALPLIKENYAESYGAVSSWNLFGYPANHDLGWTSRASRGAKQEQRWTKDTSHHSRHVLIKKRFINGKRLQLTKFGLVVGRYPLIDVIRYIPEAPSWCGNRPQKVDNFFSHDCSVSQHASAVKSIGRWLQELERACTPQMYPNVRCNACHPVIHKFGIVSQPLRKVCQSHALPGLM